MNIIEEQFKDYIESVYKGEHLCEMKLAHIRKAFIAGAFTVRNETFRIFCDKYLTKEKKKELFSELIKNVDEIVSGEIIVTIVEIGKSENPFNRN